MEMNKIMKGTALTALAAATWFAAGTTDAAAKDATNTLSPDVVNVNTYNQTLSVNVGNGNATEIYVGIGKYNDSKKTVKVSAWDVYKADNFDSDYDDDDDDDDFGVGNVDLSKLNNTKDSYIAVKTDKTEPIYIKIPAAVKGQTVKYNGGSAEVTITKVKKGTESSIDPKTCDWQYRTPYGSWQNISFYTNKEGSTELVPDKVFEQYQQQGASLYVRTSATLGGVYDADKGYIVDKKLSATKVKDADDKSTDAVEYPLYETGSFPGKESKVSIKKQANGPAVSVDYANNQVKLPKDVEYRVLADSKYYDKIDGVSANSKVDIEKFFSAGSAATSGVLEVRKAADPAKSKSASKWTLVKIVNPEAWAFEPVDGKGFEGEVMVTTNQAVEVQSTTGGSITIQYQYKNNKTKDYAGKVTVVNNGKFDFQVVIKSSDPTGTDKGVTIKKGANKSIKASKNDKVYVRKAGNKKEKDFAGKYVSVATLNQ